MTAMSILRWCLLLTTMVTYPATAQTETATGGAHAVPSLGDRPPNSAGIDIGRTGQRQSRDETARSAGVSPTARIDGRIANRIQSRLRNRIDRNYDPTSNATSPFMIAAQKSQAR